MAAEAPVQPRNDPVAACEHFTCNLPVADFVGDEERPDQEGDQVCNSQHSDGNDDRPPGNNSAVRRRAISNGRVRTYLQMRRPLVLGSDLLALRQVVT